MITLHPLAQPRWVWNLPKRSNLHLQKNRFPPNRQQEDLGDSTHSLEAECLQETWRKLEKRGPYARILWSPNPNETIETHMLVASHRWLVNPFHMLFMIWLSFFVLSYINRQTLQSTSGWLPFPKEDLSLFLPVALFQGFGSFHIIKFLSAEIVQPTFFFPHFLDTSGSWFKRQPEQLLEDALGQQVRWKFSYPHPDPDGYGNLGYIYIYKFIYNPNQPFWVFGTSNIWPSNKFIHQLIVATKVWLLYIPWNL